jgi:hypothetical protein
MKLRGIILSIALLALPLAAQTKVSGAIECGKPDKMHSIEVGDRPGHTFTISQAKCTWTKPLDFGVAQTKETLFTAVVEQTGERGQERGFSYETLSNGDHMNVRTQASNTYTKDGNISSEGKWTIGAATGKARGLKGSGTFKCAGTAEKVTCDVEGEYGAAASPAKK